MNNLVLQKLIHMYQDPQFINDRVGMPQHFNNRKEQIPMDVLQAYYKSMSTEIQQAAKFYIDQRDETNTLTLEETTKIIPAMPIFAPYKLCFVQLDTEKAIMNVLIHESPENTQDSDEPIYFLTNIPYLKEDQMFSHDYAQYAFTFHRGETYVEGKGSKEGRIVTAEDYTYWIKGHFDDYIITDPDDNGMYTNQSLEEWTQITSSIFVTLNIMLNYPEITETQEVKGRANTTAGHGTVKKLSHSILRSKPSFEHKTLKLDMYGNNDGEGSKSGTRSTGTAFHSVRKHIRRLPNGRNTFVKAHFRGSKEVGMVSKDYELT